MKKQERQNERRTLKHLEMGYSKNDTESQLLLYLSTMFCFEITATTNFESVLRNSKMEGNSTVWIEYGEKGELSNVKSERKIGFLRS